MKNTFAKKFTVCALAGVLCFALTACDDSSSAGGDGGSGGNRGGIPDTVETFMELSDFDCGKSQKCVATYLTEYHDMVVCDGNNGWVIGTLIEKMDCDFSSSSDKSSDSKSNDPAEVTDDSSDSKGNPSSAGTSTKSSNSNSSGTTTKSSSSSAGKVNGLATPCKTETEDNCEYGELVDERDGQTYKTVKIGDQWWMAENLNYEAASGSYCYGETKSDPKTENCATYGRLYIWSTAVGMSEDECVYGSYCSLLRGNVQGICPDGWHIPTNDEWGVLIIAVGGSNSSTTGVKLKATTLWKAKDGITNVDAVGFAALPAGDGGIGGGFYDVGSVTYFWSASQYKVDYPNFMTLRYDWGTASLSYCQKGAAFSVRCVKDSD